MKKIILFPIALTLIFSGVYAQDLFYDSGFRFKDRTVELGLNAGFDFSNDFFSLGDFRQERMVLDLDNFTGGLNLNTGLDITPFYLGFNINNIWGFGISANINYYGHIGLSKNLISLDQAIDEKSDASFAVFADAALNFFFNVNHFKLKFRPSVYYSVLYSKPDIVYTFDTTDTPYLNLEYDMRIYTALQIDDIDNIKFDINAFSAAPGFDISFGFEYPLYRAAGLYKVFALFDFDIGMDFMHIPIHPAVLRHYTQLSGGFTVDVDTLENVFDFIDNDDFFDDNDLFNDPVYGEDKISVERPFRAKLWIAWRPMGSRLLTLTPQLGFSINPLYLEPFSMEYGVKAKFDLINLLTLTAGVNFEDRIWKNNLHVTFNLRILELDLGIEARSYEFFNFWNTGGLGVHVGLKFGL